MSIRDSKEQFFVTNPEEREEVRRISCTVGDLFADVPSDDLLEFISPFAHPHAIAEGLRSAYRTIAERTGAPVANLYDTSILLRSFQCGGVEAAVQQLERPVGCPKENDSK